jgi:hypothetical protein
LLHSDFVAAWKAGKLQVHVERAKALQILADPAVVSPGTRRNHLFWTWLWILSVPAALVLMFYRWWAGLLLLATVTPALGIRTKKAIRQLMIDRALENSAFYDYAMDNGIIHVREKGAS